MNVNNHSPNALGRYLIVAKISNMIIGIINLKLTDLVSLEPAAAISVPFLMKAPHFPIRAASDRFNISALVYVNGFFSRTSWEIAMLCRVPNLWQLISV